MYRGDNPHTTRCEDDGGVRDAPCLGALSLPRATRRTRGSIRIANQITALHKRDVVSTQRGARIRECESRAGVADHHTLCRRDRGAPRAAARHVHRPYRVLRVALR